VRNDMSHMSGMTDWEPGKRRRGFEALFVVVDCQRAQAKGASDQESYRASTALRSRLICGSSRVVRGHER
jgi:hypothetical protein